MSYVMAATVQKLPTVEPASASRRRNRRTFRDGTAGVVPLVRLDIMIGMNGRISCTARAAASFGITYIAWVQFDACKALKKDDCALCWSSTAKGRFLVVETLRPALRGGDLSPTVKNPAIPFRDLCTRLRYIENNAHESERKAKKSKVAH